MRKIYFILNPKAGQGNKIKKLIQKIKNQVPESEIYVTKAQGDAEEFVRNICFSYSSHANLRFISCGGDGTFNEILNGVVGFPNAEVGIVPIGTGNDFCRNFDDCGDFFDISAQANGAAVSCDAIKYTSNKKTRFCANMFNIGFDCNVADLAAKLKTYPLISGALAYLLAVPAILIAKKGANLSIEADGVKIYNGPLLLTSIANGKFCGGGIKSNPDASIHNGFIDFNIIYNVSRFEFLKKFPFYMKGTHGKLPDIKKIILNLKAKKMTITPNGKSIRLCTDGEITDANKIDFECVKDAFKFVLPSINKA